MMMLSDNDLRNSYDRQKFTLDICCSLLILPAQIKHSVYSARLLMKSVTF